MTPLAIAEELIRFDSTSCYSNAAISDHVASLLQRLGCDIERIDAVDPAGLTKSNLVARLGPPAENGFAYFCHTDVVPARDWHCDRHGPFDPVVDAGRLYGRGSCDMKGSLATMVAAAARFSRADLVRPIYIVCTADEEIGFHGAKQVASRSQLYHELKESIAVGIIGEPTRLNVVHSHKGSCGFRATSLGQAAHSSSAAGRNANLVMIPFLTEMKAIYDDLEVNPAWQDGRFDPPTLSWNIGINDGGTAINVKAARSVCTVYCRPMPGMDVSPLLDRVRAAAAHCGLELDIFFEAEPFYADPGSPHIAELCRLTGHGQSRTVCYGTDAAVFGEIDRIAVCGPGDIAQAHTRNEYIELEELDRGVDFFSRAIRRWCVG